VQWRSISPVGRTPDTTAPDPRLDAEAAAWLSRLQDSARTPATEHAFKAWLAADSAHAAAFSRATDVWDLIGGAGALVDRSAPSRRPARHPQWALAATLAAVTCLAAAGLFATRDPTYRTRTGEQQSVTLSDGTRVTLNTDSKLTVDYRPGERRVKLERGEAMFEVAKNPNRPFIVAAAGEEVKALGTVFVVRRDSARVAVTLVEGKISVSAPERSQRRVLAVLGPGQRLTVRPEAGSAIDHPKLEAITAWRRGQVMFDDSSLIDAAAEMNRYGARRVVVGDPSLGGLRISGVFATSDPAAFAQAMAQIYGRSVRPEADDLVLEKATGRG
jgi:transmembrane sensor